MGIRDILGLNKGQEVTVIVVSAEQEPGSDPAVAAAIRAAGPVIRRQDVSPQAGVTTSND